MAAAARRSCSADRPWVLPGHAALLLGPGPRTARHRTALEKALEQAERLRAAAG